jgi:hypothetical protein
LGSSFDPGTEASRAGRPLQFQVVEEGPLLTRVAS